MTETQVGELLERATADLRPTTDLVAGGVAAGRRQRRRGLTLSAAGTLAAVAVVGGAVALAPGNGSNGDGGLVADGSGASTGSGPNASPSYGALPPLGTRSTDDGADPTPPGSLPSLDGPFPVLPDEMAATLTTLLHGTVTNPDDEQSPHVGLPDGWQNGAVDLDGASVTVSYQHSSGPRCDGDQALKSCAPLGDGFLGTYATKIYHKGDGYTGAHGVGVTFYTPDGYKISVTAMNAGSADPTKPVMGQPVLDDAALTAIAQSPVWR